MSLELYDMHCHIIPGVDDGAKNMEDAVAMLKMQQKQGIKNIIATPHFRFRMFEPGRELVKQQYELLKAEAQKLGMELYLGCEFHSTMEMVSMLKQDSSYSMNGSRYVLIEFSTGDKESYIRERIHALISAGYKPIIAHVERYEAMYKNYDFIEDMVDMGARIQVNADSIVGKEGFGIKGFCKKLMKYDFLSFVGSDCHDIKERVSRIKDAYEYVEKKYGTDYANDLFIKNPSKIL